jgi:hypothetical protein
VHFFCVYQRFVPASHQRPCCCCFPLLRIFFVRAAFLCSGDLVWSDSDISGRRFSWNSTITGRRSVPGTPRSLVAAQCLELHDHWSPLSAWNSTITGRRSVPGTPQSLVAAQCLELHDHWSPLSAWNSMITGRRSVPGTPQSLIAPQCLGLPWLLPPAWYDAQFQFFRPLHGAICLG